METLSLDQSAFITTFTGRRLNLWSPDPETIVIEDIAHALSNLCRFTGHCLRFYSVAEHSILISRLVEPALALEGLMHDAAEAYINDLSRPLKHHPNMTAYLDVEALVDGAIRRRFSLPEERTPAIKVADDKIVCDEAASLMVDNKWTEGHDRFGIGVLGLSPTKAEDAFLTRFEELTIW